MSDDLVRRLRGMGVGMPETMRSKGLLAEAADRIEALTANYERLMDEHAAAGRELDTQSDRIEALEAALREVVNNDICKLEYCECKYMARRALEGKS